VAGDGQSSGAFGKRARRASRQAAPPSRTSTTATRPSISGAANSRSTNCQRVGSERGTDPGQGSPDRRCCDQGQLSGRQPGEDAAGGFTNSRTVEECLGLRLTLQVLGQERTVDRDAKFCAIICHTMPTRSDGTWLSESQICEIIGLSRQRRQQWVDKQLLPSSPAEGCGLAEALAAAQLAALIGALGPTDGVIAWQQLRDELEDNSPLDRLDVLYDLQHKEALTLKDRQTVGDLICHGRPVCLVELGRLRKEIAEAHGRLSRGLAA
jgi:hypothetical protein